MSLATWKSEFYPVPAGACPAEDALDHSIRKWEGLQPEALARHGVSVDGRYLEDDEEFSKPFIIDDESCALCAHFYSDETSCERCPLAQHLGAPCDRGDDSPWWQFTRLGDATPMLFALRAAKEAQ